MDDACKADVYAARKPDEGAPLKGANSASTKDARHRRLCPTTASLRDSAWRLRRATPLLILSQVVLSLQLPFAVYPLVRLTGSKEWMGKFANGPLTAAVAWTMTAGLIGLNGVLLLGLDGIAQRIGHQTL